MKYIKKLEGRKKVLAWFLMGLWYAWTLAGISFVILSVIEKHHKAATVGSVLFFFVAIATAILLGRWLDIIKLSPKKDRAVEV